MNTDFKITDTWMSGFVDAEGCFSVYLIKLKNLGLNPSFRFYIPQKDTESLLKCLELLQERLDKANLDAKVMVGLRKGLGVMNVRVINHTHLTEVVKPLFENSPLLTSKHQDFKLFFKALELYRNKRIPINRRLIYTAHLMYAMNTEGVQRKKPLSFYEDLIKEKFKEKGEEAQWDKAVEEAKAFVEEIVNQEEPSLECDKISDDYFMGLMVGDGCFHSDFDCRSSRKITVRKGISVSLLKTKRNEELLDAIAAKYNVTWVKRRSLKLRHHFSITREDVIKDVFTPLFMNNLGLLPEFSKKQLKAWTHVDRLLYLIKSDVRRTEAIKSEIDGLIAEIYFAHEGTYRKYSLEYILNRFKEDWNL
jgi:hypothetical protein